MILQVCTCASWPSDPDVVAAAKRMAQEKNNDKRAECRMHCEMVAWDWEGQDTHSQYIYPNLVGLSCPRYFGIVV
jgi:hypothetical protein